MDSWFGSLGSDDARGAAGDEGDFLGSMMSTFDPLQRGRYIEAAYDDPGGKNPPEGPCRKMRPSAKTWQPRYFRLVCWCAYCRADFEKYAGSLLRTARGAGRDLWLPEADKDTTGQLLFYESRPNLKAKEYRPDDWVRHRGSSIMNVRGCTADAGAGSWANEPFSGKWWRDNTGNNEDHTQPSLVVRSFDRVKNGGESSLAHITFPSPKIRDKVLTAMRRLSEGKHWEVDVRVDALEAAGRGAKKAKAAFGDMGSAFGEMMTPEETGGATGIPSPRRQYGAAGFADMAAEVAEAYRAPAPMPHDVQRSPNEIGNRLHTSDR